MERRVSIVFVLTCLLLAGLAAPVVLSGGAHAAGDANSGGDAGDSFAAATLVPASGTHGGRLESADEDWYRFQVDAGDSIDIDVYAGLTTGSIQVGDANRRIGVHLYDPNGVLLDTPNTNVGDARVTWPTALVGGEYRLRFMSDFLGARYYSFCFVVDALSCATFGLRPIDLGSPLATTHAEVLLVPPMNGNTFGDETLLDYLDATMAGIHKWQDAIDAFAADYPQFAYLQELTVHVELFDGVAPQRAGYDVVIVWLPYTGPQFRGLAVTAVSPGPLYTAMCLSSGTCATWARDIEPLVHDGSRQIFMSLFANSPRAGQVLPDYPEWSDVYNVAMHEFAHTWGLGHTQTFLQETRADLMNSPYTEVFGDGHPISDGGERTPAGCISSLDLYGLARLYEWVGRDVDYRWRNVPSTASLPSWMPYTLYC